MSTASSSESNQTVVKCQIVFLDSTSALLPGGTREPTRIFLEALSAVSNTKSTPIRIIRRSELIESISRRFDANFADSLKSPLSAPAAAAAAPVAPPPKGGKAAPPAATAVPVPAAPSANLSHADMTRVLNNFTPEDLAVELRKRIALECGRTLAYRARNNTPGAVHPPSPEFPPRDPALDATYALIEETGEKILSEAISILFLVVGGPTGVAETAALLPAIGKKGLPIIPMLEGEADVHVATPPTESASTGEGATTLRSLFEAAGWGSSIPPVSIVGDPICLELLNTPKAVHDQKLLAEAEIAHSLHAKTIEVRTGVKQDDAPSSSSGISLSPADQFSSEIDSVWGHVVGLGSATALRALKRTFKSGESLLKISDLLERTSRGHHYYPLMTKWALMTKCKYNLVRDVAVLTLHLDEAIVSPDAIVSLFFKTIVQHMEVLESYLYYMASASVSVVPDFEDLSLSGGFDSIESLASVNPNQLRQKSTDGGSNAQITNMASKAAESYISNLAYVPTGSVGVATVLYALVEAVSSTAVACDVRFHIDSNRLIAVPSTPLFLSSLVAVDEPASSGTSSSGRVGGSTRFGAFVSPSSSSTGVVNTTSADNNPMSYRGHGSSIHDNMDAMGDIGRTKDMDDALRSHQDSAGASSKHIDPSDTVISSGALPTSVMLQLPSLSQVPLNRFVPFSVLIARYKEAFSRSWDWFDRFSSSSSPPGALHATSATYVRLVRAAASLGCGINDLRLGPNGKGVPILVADRVSFSSLIPLDEWPLPPPPPDRAPANSFKNLSLEGLDSHDSHEMHEALIVKHTTPGSTGTEFEELAAMTSITRDLTRKTLLFRSIESLLQASDTAAAANYVSLFERRIMNGSEAAETHQWNLSRWDWTDELDDDPILLVEAMVQAAVDAGSVSLAAPSKLDKGGLENLAKGNSLVGGGTACLAIRDPTSSSLIVAFHTLTPRRRIEFKQEWQDDVVPHSSAAKPDLNLYLTTGISRPVSTEERSRPSNSKATTDRTVQSQKSVRPGNGSTAHAVDSSHSKAAVASHTKHPSAAPSAHVEPELMFIDSGYRFDFDHSGPPVRTLCSLYPADHAVIRTVVNGFADGEPRTAVTVVKEGIYFGLRDTQDKISEDASPSIFFADFPGDRLPGSSGITSGARCTIRAVSFPQAGVFPSSIPTSKKNKNATKLVIISSYTTMDGLTVEVSSDGSITQRHQRSSGSHSATLIAQHLAPILIDGAMQSITSISTSTFDVYSEEHDNTGVKPTVAESKQTEDTTASGATATKRPESARKVPFPNVKVPLPSPLGTLEPVSMAQFPPWPSWLPEISRSVIGPRATTVRILRFGVKHILRSNGHTAWILPSDLAKRSLSFALKASAVTPEHVSGSKGDPSSEYKDPWWLESTQSMRIDTYPDGRRVASVNFSVTFDKVEGEHNEKKPSTIKLALPPVEIHVTQDSATRASCAVRYDTCPVPDPKFVAPLPPVEKAPILFKRAKEIMHYRDSQKYINLAHSSERRAQLGGLWAGLETDSTGFSPIFDGNGTGPQLGRSCLAVYPGSRRLSLAIHADGTHIVTEGSRERVTTSCRGFATTEVDSNFEAVGYGHSRNDPSISTSQMGPRTRSVTTLHDGAAIAVDYDCSITAAASARVRIHRPDGAAIIALDSGLVHFRPPGVTAGPLPDPTKLDSALAARVRRESANATSSLRTSTLAASLSATGTFNNKEVSFRQGQSQRARSASPSKSPSKTNTNSSALPHSKPARGTSTANFNWTGKFADGDASEVTTADLLKDELHWDILYAAASMELGRGIVPDAPPEGGAYEFFVFPPKRGKDKSLVMRTLDHERNQFYLNRREDGECGLIPRVVLGGCVLPKGVNGEDLSIVPSFDKSITPLLTAAVPGTPHGSTIVIPRINSPRPPSVFIIHKNGSGVRLISPEERQSMSRVALSSDLPHSAFLLVKDIKNRNKNDTLTLVGEDREEQVKRKHIELSQKGGWPDHHNEHDGKNSRSSSPPPPKAAGGGQRIPSIAPLREANKGQNEVLAVSNEECKRTPAPIGSSGPPPILQVFVASPLSTDALLALKSRSYTGLATPVAYPVDTSGSGLFLTNSSTTPLNSLTDEIRTSQAAWVVNMGPRMARFTVPEVFGETARISPAMIALQKKKEAAAALLRALDAAGDPFNSSSGGRSGVPQQPFAKQIITTTSGGAGGAGGVKFQNVLPPPSTTSSPPGTENDDDLSSIALAVRERILPRIICVVPAILAPPYALILPPEGGIQTRNPSFTVPFDIPAEFCFYAPPPPLYPAPALWRSIRQNYNLSLAERSILEQDEHEWRAWRMNKAHQSLNFDSVETRSKEEIEIEMAAAKAVREARARFDASNSEATKVFNPLSRVRAAASALAFGERMRKDLEEGMKARQEAKAAREAAEFAAAEVAAMQLLKRDVIGARGTFSTLGSTEIDIAVSDASLLSGASHPNGPNRNGDNSSIIEVDDVAPGGGRGPANSVVVAITAADGEVLRVRVPVPNQAARLPPGVSSGEPGGLMLPLLPPLARMQLHADSVNSRVGSSRDTTRAGEAGAGPVSGRLDSRVYEVLVPPEGGGSERNFESSRKSTSSEYNDEKGIAFDADAAFPVSQGGSITSEGSSLVTAPEGLESAESSDIGVGVGNIDVSGQPPHVGAHVPSAVIRDRQAQEDEAAIQRAINPKTGKPYDEATKQRMRVAAVRKREQELGRAKAAALEVKRTKELLQAPAARAAQAAADAEAARKRDLVEKKKLGFGVPSTSTTDTVEKSSQSSSRSPVKDIEDALKRESPGVLLSALVDSSLSSEGRSGAAKPSSYRSAIAGHSTVGLGNGGGNGGGLTVIHESKHIDSSSKEDSTIGGAETHLEDGDDIARLEAMIRSQTSYSGGHALRIAAPSGGGGIAAARALSQRGSSDAAIARGINATVAAREFAGDGVSSLDIPSNATVPVPVSTGVIAPSTGMTSTAIVSPSAVRFGTLVAGNSYEFEVMLHNTASGLLRFRVGRAFAQGRGGGQGNAVTATHEPGPIARGMARSVAIRINCRQPGVVSEIVSLILPGEEIGIPVSAKIIAAGEGGEATSFGVRLV